MAKVDFDTALGPLLARDTRYGRGAYHFVREALDYTQAILLKQGEPGPRHVTGRELLEGIRSYALEQFGPMACTVFEDWGVRRCDDFGEIVFNMIEFQILSKTDADRPEDFKGGYDFEAAFRRPFVPVRGAQASAPA
ncbi:MAG: Minf_1886 family protein [Verrucomicrobiota bacterium]